MEADQRHAALAGIAIQTVNRLPHVVPTPNNSPLTEPDSASWQANSFQAPLQVWHQLKAFAVSHLPRATSAFWSLAQSNDSNVAMRRGVYQVAGQALSWTGLQQLGGEVAGRLPRLVPMGFETSVDEEDWSQVGSIIAASG